MSSPEAQALALKNEGNALYKARSFEQAAEKYSAAYELHKDITYLNNLAGMLVSPSTCASCSPGLLHRVQRRTELTFALSPFTTM